MLNQDRNAQFVRNGENVTYTAAATLMTDEIPGVSRSTWAVLKIEELLSVSTGVCESMLRSRGEGRGATAYRALMN
ncbi:MAG: hypothetical protein R3A47_08970 [Polyangiales bacterium]